MILLEYMSIFYVCASGLGLLLGYESIWSYLWCLPQYLYFADTIKALVLQTIRGCQSSETQDTLYSHYFIIYERAAMLN